MELNPSFLSYAMKPLVDFVLEGGKKLYTFMPPIAIISRAGWRDQVFARDEGAGLPSKAGCARFVLHRHGRKCMRFLTTVIVVLGLSPFALAEEAPAPCSGDEYRQMDFWVGTWDLTWTNADGTTGIGKNVVTRTLGGCVIEENFTGPGLTGRSHSIYHKHSKKWRQVWVDNQGGFFDLVGGREQEGFLLNLVRLSDKTPYLRMFWLNIGEDSLEWYWRRSDDGEDNWKTLWHITYQRAE
jgi:hypothetical protein